MDIQKFNSNRNISFLRIRPCDSDNEIYLNSRKKEGTSSFVVKDNLKLNLNNIHNKNFQTISKTLDIDSDFWFIDDENWKEFNSLNSKRLIYTISDNKEEALEILSRLKPGIVLVNNIEQLSFLSNLNFNKSFYTAKYVNEIEEADRYINNGIDSIWLRDWSIEDINKLQNLSDYNLYETTLISSKFSINEARQEFSKETFTRFLLTKDVRGYKRMETNWYPGSGQNIPKLKNFSFNNISNFESKEFAEIIQKIQTNEEISDEDLKNLFLTSGSKVNQIANNSFSDTSSRDLSCMLEHKRTMLCSQNMRSQW